MRNRISNYELMGWLEWEYPVGKERGWVTREGIWAAAKIMGRLKGCLWTRCSRVFKKYVHTWRWSNQNHQIMRDWEPQLFISCYQLKLPIPGLDNIQLNCWQKGSKGNPQTTMSDLLPILYYMLLSTNC